MREMERAALLVCFSIKSKRFQNVQERNKFFRALYGWRQIIPAEHRVYEYERPGILDEIPHFKVDQSSFVVREEEFDKILNFFEQWSKKVIWRTFKILLEDEDWKELEMV